VWTSGGVLVGIALVALTGWQWLDPAVALAVGLNILIVGYGLLRGSVSSLLSATLPEADRAKVEEVLDRYRAEQVEFAPLRTMESGRERYVFAVITVPGEWTVREAHDMAERIEADIDAALPMTETFIHVEPRQQSLP
jgi:cation diffusion facilitator family transporter